MIYICGKYSRLPHSYAVAKFNATERQLISLGVSPSEIINPVKLVPEDTEWQSAMDNYCLPAIRCASAVFAQSDYVDSDGAQIEIAEAINCGIPIFYEDNFNMTELLRLISFSRDSE